MKFKALVSSESNKKFESKVQSRTIQDLPEGDILIKVYFSSLNYKDALSAIGNKGVSRNYPHTPGIDAAGIIETSESKNFNVGEEVIVTGYDLGMNTHGGFSEFIRVPEKWAVLKPKSLNTKAVLAVNFEGNFRV